MADTVPDRVPAPGDVGARPAFVRCDRAGRDAEVPVAITLVIADDQSMIRTGRRLIVENAPGIEVVGEAAARTRAGRLPRKPHPRERVRAIAFACETGFVRPGEENRPC
ncbi:hypothetical protein GCM10017673_54440 [Streptosporangium violaceochromogenes]|nr:hypothetical protein GCM10017673_54440 [Streptosporangium violaceochromogenes]